MKKSALFASLILILAAIGCGEDKIDIEEATTCSVDLVAEGFGGNAAPSWQPGIKAGGWLNGERNFELFHLSSKGADRFCSSATMTPDGDIFICYPYNADAELSGQLMEIPFPSVFEVPRPGDCPSGLPSAGHAPQEEGKVNLYQLTGFLSIPVIGGAAVKSVTVTPAEKGACSGRLMADFSYGEPPIVRLAAGEDRSMTVKYLSSLDLPLTDTVSLLVPLPPGTYNDLEIVIDAGWEETTSRTIKIPVVINRAGIAHTGPIRVKNPMVLKSFSFKASDNPNLEEDVEFLIDPYTNTVSSRIDYYAGLKSMISTFELAEGAVAYVNGTVQESGVTARNFYKPVTYVVVDASGMDFTYTVSVDHFTGLPVMIVNTPDAHPVDSKTVWIENTIIHLDGVGLYDDYDTVTDDPDFIRGRGNATWQRFAKKGMNIKLGKKASLLGMPAHKRWCLMANYRDRIKIRNDIAFYMANGMGAMGWNPHGEFVELILNGKHWGMYEVVEQIKIDDNRLDLTEFETDENDQFVGLDENTITGGYIFMIDAYYDEEFKFRSKYLNSPVEFKDPNDNITPEMMAYAKDYFERFEYALQKYDFSTVYSLIDMDSFIDFWLLNDLVENDDAANQHSVFVHKDRGGKLFAGPVWDFDSFTWRSTGDHFNMRKKIWYPYLLQDKAFCRRAVERWNTYRDFILTIPQYAEQRCASIEKSEAYDAALWWPIRGNANNFGDEHLSFRAALERMQKNFNGRFANMEKYLSTIESAARYDSHADGK